jgi:hypothetical protein
MKRYSVFSKVAQDWLISEGKFFLNLSGRLDVDGLYRDSESYLNYGVRLSGLLRISANDDVVNMGDEISVDSLDGRDVDNVYVEDVNPDRNLNVGEFYHGSGPVRHGLIYKGDQSKISTFNIADVSEMMSKLSVGGRDVYLSLKSLGDSIGEFSNQSLGTSIRKALFNYYKNPIFFENILEVNNIVRDINEGVVNRDTVALFSKALDIYKKRQGYYSKRVDNLEKLIDDRVPELRNYGDLKKELLNESKENFEVYLEKFENVIKVLKSNDADSDLIKKIIESGILTYNYDLVISSPKEVIAYFIYSKIIDTGNIENIVHKLKNVSEDLWPSLIQSNTFSSTHVDIIKLYSVLMPDILSDVLQNEHVPNNEFPTINNFKLGEVNYRSLMDIYVVYKMAGKEALYSLDALEDAIFDNPVSSKVYNDLRYVNPNLISSQGETEDMVLSRIMFSSMKEAYDEELEKKMGDKNYALYTSSHNFGYLDFVPAYLKMMKDPDSKKDANNALRIVNRYYPYLGEKIFDNDLKTLDNFDNTNSKGLFKDLELLSKPEIKHREILSLYNDNPILKSLNFSEWFAFNNKVFPGDFDDDIVIAKQKYNFVRSMKISGLVLYMFGDDPKIYKDGDILGKVNSIVGQVQDVKSAEFYKNLILKDFVGSKDVLNTYRKGFDLNRFTPAELSFSYNKLRDEDIDKIVKIRKSISRSKNYAGISWGSPEYEKIFVMISNEWEVRGRDPKLLTELFDAAVYDKNNPVSLLCGYVNAASGIDDFSKVKDSMAKISSIESTLGNDITSLENRYSLLFKDLKLVKEQVINIGGFNVLFSEDPDVLVRVLNIRDTNVEEFKSNLIAHKAIRGSYFDSAIRVDYNLLKSKYIIYGLKLFFEEYPEAKEMIDAGKNLPYNKFEGFNNITKSLGDKLLNDSDNFIPEIYGIKFSLGSSIKFPKNNYQQDIRSYDENIANAGKIVAIFNLDSYRILDKYSFKICQQNGLPTKGFKYIPNLALKAEIIHDLGNLLPSNITNKKFDGLADYYIQYLGTDDKNLKFVADAWNDEISLLDEDMHFLESGLVKEFAKEYEPSKLSKLIKRNNAKNLFRELKPKSTKFGLEYLDNFNAPSSSESLSSDFKILYRGCEDIYLRGLRVPMPSWSSFTTQEGDMTLRFLPREDPRGLMLGKITECCQEPTSWAASCAYDGHLNPLAAFAVFEIGNEIIFQSYVWSDEEGNICFDSVEGLRDNRNNKEKVKLARQLLLNFKDSVDGKCTVGSNVLRFNEQTERLINPTKTHEENDIKSLLVKFSPNKEDFYDGDSRRQSIVV